MKTVATRSGGSFGRRRTTRPTAWRKNKSVRLAVAYAARTRRGTSTPSLTMLTATSQRGALASPRAKRSIRVWACGSSLSTTTGFSPAIVRSSALVARA